VQYVSPQVWAWRQGRVKTIGESCDLVLCLLPFEPPFYAEHRVRAEFVGHPLADQIPMQVDRAAARRELGLSPDARVLALLPGSRRGEVERLGADFAAAARALAARVPGLQVIAPMASRSIGDLFRKLANSDSGGSSIRILDGQARTALAACDVAIVASGTATLETALSKRPMVVAYRLGAVTAFLLRRFGLVKVAHFSQPNLLAGRGIVHEYFQEQVTGDALASAAGDWLREPARVAQLEAEFVRIHQQLKVGGASLAAAHILALAGRSPAGER
jgi:lipid-A-disaccharide synthase